MFQKRPCTPCSTGPPTAPSGARTPAAADPALHCKCIRSSALWFSSKEYEPRQTCNSQRRPLASHVFFGQHSLFSKAEDLQGYRIREFSKFQSEDEVLVEPVAVCTVRQAVNLGVFGSALHEVMPGVTPAQASGLHLLAVSFVSCVPLDE